MEQKRPRSILQGRLGISAIEILDLFCAGRVAKLADGLVFDLTDALTRNTEDLTDLLKRVRAAVVHTEAHTQHVRLTLGQCAENLGQRLREHGVGCCIDGTGGIIVLDKGADGRILFIADGHIERERIGCSAVGFDDFFNREVQLCGDLLQRRLTAQLLYELAVAAGRLVDDLDQIHQVAYVENLFPFV